MVQTLRDLLAAHASDIDTAATHTLYGILKELDGTRLADGMKVIVRPGESCDGERGQANPRMVVVFTDNNTETRDGAFFGFLGRIIDGPKQQLANGSGLGLAVTKDGKFQIQDFFVQLYRGYGKHPEVYLNHEGSIKTFDSVPEFGMEMIKNFNTHLPREVAERLAEKLVDVLEPRSAAVSPSYEGPAAPAA